MTKTAAAIGKLRKLYTVSACIHHPMPIAALVGKNYIVEYRQPIIGCYISRYSVPVGVHRRWCKWCKTLPEGEGE